MIHGIAIFYEKEKIVQDFGDTIGGNTNAQVRTGG
jgi:hypothetical protein